ncbi:hypothetical protein KC921_04600 [Candidatus Woesebacteria bacterium]|nr:hypothetical protein [Candidatus Woesebacteria bacterium]
MFVTFLKLTKSLRRSHFVRGGVIFGSTSFLVSILNYGFNLLVARSFPLATYGEYMAALSYLALFGVPLGSIGILLIQKIGQQPPEHRLDFVLGLEQWLWQQIAKRWLSICVITTVLFGFLWWKSGLSLLSLIFVFLLSVLSTFSLIYTVALQAFKRFFEAGGLSIVSTTVKLCGLLIVLLVSKSLFGVYGVLLLAGLVMVLFGRFLVRRNGKSASPMDIATRHVSLARFLKQKSFLIPIITSLGLVGILSADVILAKKVLPPDDVGLYAALSLLSKIILYVAAPLGTVAFTFFTGKESQQQRTKILLLTTMALLCIGVVSIGSYLFLPNIIISVIFGSKYDSIQSFVWLSAVFGLLYSLANVFAQYWISRQSWLAVASVFALALQILGIIIFHSSLGQIMSVNIVLTGILLLVYSLGFGRLLLENKLVRS